MRSVINAYGSVPTQHDHQVMESGKYCNEVKTGTTDKTSDMTDHNSCTLRISWKSTLMETHFRQIENDEHLEWLVVEFRF